MGFGDFLAGCMGVLEYCSSKNIEVLFDVSKHPIAEFLANSLDHSCPKNIRIVNTYCDHEKTKLILDTYFDTSQKELGLISDLRPSSYELEDLTRPIQKFLTFAPIIVNQLKIYKKMYNIESSYVVFHIRLDDSYFRGEPFESRMPCKEKILKIANELYKDKQIIILSNNQQFKETIAKEIGAIAIPSEPGHLGIKGTQTNLTAACIDMEIMKHSSEIIQFSMYKWGSWFSTIVANAFNIPLTKIPIHNELIEYYKSTMGCEFDYHNKD